MAIRVLVIDDSVTVLHAACQLLEQHGIETRQARNPLDALTHHLVDNHEYDVVITDTMMPGFVSADYLMRLIQRCPGLGFVPVIVLSSHTGQEIQLRFADLGAAAFFPKPWDNDILVGTVRRLGTEHQRMRAARALAPAK